MTTTDWAKSRLKEVSTWTGGALVALSQLGLTTNGSNPTADTVLHLFNQTAPIIGGMLMGATTKP